MGVLDFFFGRTKPTPTTTTTVQSSKLPEEIAPYVKDVLAEAQRLYDEGKERGYEEYPGMTIAPRTPEEEKAIAGLRGLIGTQDTYLQEAEAALRGIPQEFTTEQAEKFMSPYQQAVIDIEKRKAEEDFQRKVMPEFERQAVQAGGMSGLGSRAGVQAARLGEAFSQQLGDIQSRGQQKAYEDAYKRFQDQMAMDRARAADLQGIGLTKFQTGIAEQGLAQQLAQADRQEMQATLDEQYAKYLEREQYPKQELAQLSSFVYGNPFLRTPDRTTTAQGMLQPNAPGVGQQLLGLGLSGLNIFGMGGGFGPGGFSANRIFQGPGGTTRSALKTGGRIVYKQEGGGLGNLPVVKRQVGSRVAPSGRLTQKQVEYLRSLRPDNTDIRIRNLLRDSQGRLPSYKQTGLTYAQRYREAFSPKLTASQLLGKDPVWPLPENEIEKLQYDMANYPGQDDSLAEILRGNPLVEAAVQRRTPVPLQKKSTGLPTLATKVGPIPKSISTVDDAVKLLSDTGSQRINAAADQRAAELDASLSVNIPKALEPKSSIVDKSSTKVTDSTGLIGLRSKVKNANVDIVNRLINRAREIGERRDVDRATFEAMPEANAATRREILEIKNAGNKQLAAQEAANVTELDKMQKGFADADQKALDNYEKDKMDRLEKARQAWPGAEIAAAIDAGMDEPSLVTMLSKVMNVGAAGISKRTEKINDKMDKLKDVMFEKETELRGKNEQRTLNVLEKKQTNLINSILRDTTFKADLAELPIKQRADVISAIKSLAALDTSKDTTLINIAKVLTDILEETGTDGDVSYGIAGGYKYADPKDTSNLLSYAGITPTGDKSSSQLKAASMEMKKIFNEIVAGKHRDKIRWNKSIASKVGSVRKVQEDIPTIFKDRIEKAMRDVVVPTQTKDMKGYNTGQTSMGRTFKQRLGDTAKRATEEKKDN